MSGCGCMDKIDAKLAEQNLRLATTIVCVVGPGGGFRAYPRLMTEFVDETKKKRGQKAPTFIPSRCPFCGIEYDAGGGRAEGAGSE